MSAMLKVSSTEEGKGNVDTKDYITNGSVAYFIKACAARNYRIGEEVEAFKSVNIDDDGCVVTSKQCHLMRVTNDKKWYGRPINSKLLVVGRAREFSCRTFELINDSEQQEERFYEEYGMESICRQLEIEINRLEIDMLLLGICSNKMHAVKDEIIKDFLFVHSSVRLTRYIAALRKIKAEHENEHI